MEKTVYTVKNVKTFMGREGKGFNATLYKNGKNIGMVIDSANGGCYSYQLDREEQELLEKYAKENLTLEERSINGKEITLELSDIFMDKLINEFLTTQTFKRKCKKKTLFTTNKTPKGSYIEINTPFTPEIKKRLIEKHSKDDLVILNEVYK